MFIRDTTKTLFQVMSDFDNSSDPETRAKELRHAVDYYNEYSGMNHSLTSEILNLYWVWCENTDLSMFNFKT